MNHSVIRVHAVIHLGGESIRERVNHPFMLRFTRQFNSVVKFTGRITGLVIAPVNRYVNVWITRSRCGSPGNSTVAVWITGRFPCRVNCPANRPVNWVRGVFQMIHWVIRLVIQPPSELHNPIHHPVNCPVHDNQAIHMPDHQPGTPGES